MMLTAPELEKQGRITALRRSLNSWTLCVNLLTQSISIPIPNDYRETITPPKNSSPTLKRDLNSLIAGRRQIVILQELIDLETQGKE